MHVWCVYMCVYIYVCKYIYECIARVHTHTDMYPLTTYIKYNKYTC